ncbi:MAG: DUF4062 domain-containing protein [Chloroflexi bacterium]|nr:MAG: DUF4062 domain-containing protein [Chloroflexota bacterium]
MDPNQHQHLQKLLTIQRRNLYYIEQQIALHGGEMNAPLDKLNQRDLIRAEIEKLEAQLRPVAAPETGSTPVQAQETAGLPSVRVFISSTMRDLQAERKAVAEALESLDLAVVRAETVGSQSASPYEASLMMAQNCDIYLGIFGKRYGTIVPNDPHGRSITHIEFDLARQQGKPILIYRKTDEPPEPEQEEFLNYVGDLMSGHIWRDFNRQDVPIRLKEWVRQDVRTEIERQLDHYPEWRDRPPARERVLLASLGLSPGAVVGLYSALTEIQKRPSRVVTLSTAHKMVRQAGDICREAFEARGVPYSQRFIDAEEIISEQEAQAFKGLVLGQLQEHLESGAEVILGVTGGRTVMGTLLTLAVQGVGPEKSVVMYHLYVDEEIERDGRLPDLLRFRYDTAYWNTLIDPPPDRRSLVPIPFVRLPDNLD